MERLNAFPTDLSFGAPVKFGGGGNTNGGAGGNALKHSSSGIAVTTTTTTNNTDADVGGVYSQQHCPMAQANFTYNILGGGVNDFNNTREILSSFDVDNDDMASNFGGDYYGNNSYGDGGGGTGNVPRGPKRRGM